MNTHTPTPNDAQPVNPKMEPMRLRALIGKVSTAFGSLYVNLAFDANGRPCEVRISSQQRHEDTAVGQALDAIGAEITNLMEEGNGQT